MGIAPEPRAGGAALDVWTPFVHHVIALDWRRTLGLLEVARLDWLETEGLVVLAQEQQRQDRERRNA